MGWFFQTNSPLWGFPRNLCGKKRVTDLGEFHRIYNFINSEKCWMTVQDSIINRKENLKWYLRANLKMQSRTNISSWQWCIRDTKTILPTEMWKDKTLSLKYEILAHPPTIFWSDLNPFHNQPAFPVTRSVTKPYFQFSILPFHAKELTEFHLQPPISSFLWIMHLTSDSYRCGPEPSMRIPANSLCPTFAFIQFHCDINWLVIQSINSWCKLEHEVCCV